MDLKLIRNIHLYLGVFFAPLLLFFVMTGFVQTFNWHEEGSPKFIQALSQVHKHQRLACGQECPEPSMPFRFLIALMCAGLLLTTILGIMMAFKYRPGWNVWICLVAGIIIPFLMFLIH